MITLYTTHCPMCDMLQKRLTEQNITYNTISDLAVIQAYGAAHNLTTAPILDVNGEALGYAAAMKWAKEQGK